MNKEIAKQEGEIAFNADNHISNNPYKLGTPYWKNWSKGWIQASMVHNRKHLTREITMDLNYRKKFFYASAAYLGFEIKETGLAGENVEVIQIPSNKNEKDQDVLFRGDWFAFGCFLASQMRMKYNNLLEIIEKEKNTDKKWYLNVALRAIDSKETNWSDLLQHWTNQLVPKRS